MNIKIIVLRHEMSNGFRIDPDRSMCKHISEIAKRNEC